MTARNPISRAIPWRAAALAAALALPLAACGGSSSRDADYACPKPFTVQDAERLTHFKEGAGRDPRDIAYEATLVSAATGCKVTKSTVDVTLVVRIAATAGPAVSPGRTAVPFFVRVIDSSGAIVQGQEFTSELRLSAANPQSAIREELSLTLSRSGAYRIAVGLKPTQEELNYNRRGR
jgi:hypothetical protein